MYKTEDLLTVTEIAEQLRVSGTAVRNWLKQGALPGIKLAPRVWRIRRADFEQFISERTNRRAVD